MNRFLASVRQGRLAGHGSIAPKTQYNPSSFHFPFNGRGFSVVMTSGVEGLTHLFTLAISDGPASRVSSQQCQSMRSITRQAGGRGPSELLRSCPLEVRAAR
jgi:hypothetical protein